MNGSFILGDEKGTMERVGMKDEEEKENDERKRIQSSNDSG